MVNIQAILKKCGKEQKNKEKASKMLHEQVGYTTQT